MIMIIAHDEQFRETFSQFLRDRHMQVHVAPHRQDVSAMVKSVNPYVLVLDMYVSEPSGLNLLRQLRAEGFQGKVVALSGSSMSRLVPEAYRLGVDQVVGAPKGSDSIGDMEQIECAIRAVIHDLIANRAFDIYVAKGRGHGQDAENWLEAERQILSKSSRENIKKNSPRVVDSDKK